MFVTNYLRKKGKPGVAGRIGRVAAILVIATSSGFATAESILYALDNSSGNASLYTLDQATGNATLIGATGLANAQSLTYDQSTGLLYTFEVSGNALYSIDPLTAAVNELGVLNTEYLTSLAFSEDGSVLFGNDIVSDQLISIDLLTLDITAIGSPGPSFTGIASHPNADTLFGYQSGALYTLDTATAQSTFVAGIESPNTLNISGLAYDPIASILYGIQIGDGRNLVSIDVNTGEPTRLGSHGLLNAAALAVAPGTAVVPVPPAVGIGVLGLGIVGLVRRRKQELLRERAGCPVSSRADSVHT